MAKITSFKRIDHPKYECTRCSNVNGFIGYRVKLYLITDGDRCYVFHNQTDWIQNFNLMREHGDSVSTFTHDIIVTPMFHHDIFMDINRYVSEANID